MNENLTKEDIRLFEILRSTRKRQAETLKERALRGVRRSVVVKYADPGHFIYELLQNADDALATRVEIILNYDSIVFKHNGKIQFTITDEQDESIAPGHLNSITAIGLSDKENATNKIGKFGVGFKSVLQYTDVPYIYDDKFWFKIEDMLYPSLLDEDHPEREAEETLFYFKLKNAEQSYKEIKDKLQNLDNPVLFLHSVDTITWSDRTTDDNVYVYKKDTVKDYSDISRPYGLSCQLIETTNSDFFERMFMFSKNIKIGGETHTINVAYLLDDEGEIDIQITPTVYCFFRTEEIQEGQKFICHAPFLLTDSRQTILKNDVINEQLKMSLADMAAYALPALRDIGIREGHYYLNETLFDIVPLKEKNDAYCSQHFYNAFKNILKEERLILSRNKLYKLPTECFTAIPADLIDYLTDSQLQQLTGRENVDFVSRELSVRINAIAWNNILKPYCQEIGFATLRSEDLAKTISESFMDHQEGNWHIRLYHFLLHFAEKLWKIDPSSTRKTSDNLPFRQSPIIKNSEGRWVAPYLSDGTLNVFFPIDGQANTTYNFVARDIIDDKIGFSFLNELGVKKPDELDFIKNTILPKYSPVDRPSLPKKEIEDDFETIFSITLNTSAVIRKELVSILRERFSLVQRGTLRLKRPSQLYDEGNENLKLLSTLKGYKAQYYFNYEEQLKLRIQAAMERDKQEKRKEWENDVNDGDIDPDEEPFEEWYEEWYGSDFEDEFEDEEADKIVTNNSYISEEHSIRFVNLSFYDKSIDLHGYEEVLSFMREMGLHSTICINQVKNFNKYSFPEELQTEFSDRYSTSRSSFDDYIIEGLDYLFDRNQGCPSELGQWLWNELSNIDFSDKIEGTHHWFYYTPHSANFQASWILLLKHSRWLLGEHKPSEVTQEDLLNAGYRYSETLFELFDVSKGGKSMEELGASQEQITNEALGKKLRLLGITDSDIEELVRIKRTRGENTKQRDDQYNDDNHSSSYTETSGSNNFGERAKENTENWNRAERTDDDEIQDAYNDSPFTGREELSKPSMDSMFHSQPQRPHTQSAASSKSTSEKVEELKERMQEDERHEKEIIDLQEQADNLPKYSVEWFKTLLQLEYQGSVKEFVNKDKKALSISFSRVLREPDSDRIYILKNPSRNIPMWIEEVGGLSVVFQFNNREEVKFNFEVGNVRDYTLRLKAKTIDAPDLLEIDWGKCTRATINVNNPIELVGSLKDAFNQLPFNPEFNLKNGLASVKDINFVFGPPGTGKTTWLSKRISSLIEESRSCKILVLAPTNKACDVLARKILDTNKEDYSWVYRFVASGDEYLEDMGIVADRESDVHMMDKVCLISTMARLSFDGFRGDYSQRLMDIEWDYVICDEASMIPLAQMMLTIYRFKQSKIYIAGDPLQIGPILREPRWQEENIYTMINLNRFDNPKTEPVQFKIENLPKQYRALPAIGELFSQYAYNGKLIHHRSLLKYKKPYLGEIDFNFINFISFKVEKYDSIFGAKKLDGSNVHIYSALMTVETALYVAKKYASKEKEEVYHIGIICPYAPQAQLVERLIEQQECLPVNVEINVGTIHSFQGDECDMILTLMNPPTGMKGAADKIFLNRQNIINVAISRAKNILCVIMPHCNTDGYENLYELNRLGHIASQLKNSVNLYTCDEIEEVIFGQKFFLENNTFVTSHQLANVYTKPVKRYEVRIDESSIDIQVGKTGK